MTYDAANDSLLFTGDFKLMKVTVDTAQCSYVSSASFTPLDLWPLTADTMLELTFNSLHIVDFKTSQSVTISR